MEAGLQAGDSGWVQTAFQPVLTPVPPGQAGSSHGERWALHHWEGFQVPFKAKEGAPDKTKQRHLACVLLVKILSQQ